MTGYTPGDNLPYPDSYTEPADSPNAFQALALAVQAALDADQAEINARPTGVATEATYVKGPTATVVTDWNDAIPSGFYQSLPGAANVPVTSQGNDYWLGFVTCLDPSANVRQVAWPAGAAGYPPAVMLQRAMLGGVWGAWARISNYLFSWGTTDNFMTHRHGPGDGVSRFATGMAKDPLNGNPSDSDEWRVQCYTPAGVFTWSAIKIPESGIVSMPRGHAVLRERIAAGDPIPADTVLTVGALADILRAGVGPGELNIAPPTEET